METDNFFVGLVGCFLMGLVIYFACRNDKKRNAFLMDQEAKLRREGYDWFLYGLGGGSLFDTVSLLGLDLRRGIVSFVEVDYDDAKRCVQKWTASLANMGRIEASTRDWATKGTSKPIRYQLELWPQEGPVGAVSLYVDANRYRSFENFEDHVRILIEAWEDARGSGTTSVLE